MAQYCRLCGSPLVNGRCPRCQPSPAPSQTDGIGAQVAAFYRGGDALRLIPASGYAALALVWLLRFLFGLFDYYPGMLFGWLELLACAAVAVDLACGRKNTVRACAAALLGLMALLNLITFITFRYFGFSYTTPAMIVLLCGIGITAKDGWLRLAGLALGAALVITLVLSALSVIANWPLLLIQCGGSALVFLWCVADFSKGRQEGCFAKNVEVVSRTVL